MAITMLFLQLSLSLSSSQATLLLYSSGKKQTLNYSADPEVGSQQGGTLSPPHGVSSAEVEVILGPGVHISSQHSPSLSTAFATGALISPITHSLSGIISMFNEHILTKHVSVLLNSQ